MLANRGVLTVELNCEDADPRLLGEVLARDGYLIRQAGEHRAEFLMHHSRYNDLGTDTEGIWNDAERVANELQKYSELNSTNWQVGLGALRLVLELWFDDAVINRVQ